MPDALTVAARANHLLVAVLLVAGLAFAAIGAALNDTFYLRLATESARPVCCRSDRHCISGWAPTSRRWS